MPQDYATRLTPQQIDTLVNYLLQQVAAEQPAVTVIGEDAATAVPKAIPAKQAIPPAPTPDASLLAVQLSLLLIVFLLTLFLLWKRPFVEEK